MVSKCFGVTPNKKKFSHDRMVWILVYIPRAKTFGDDVCATASYSKRKCKSVWHFLELQAPKKKDCVSQRAVRVAGSSVPDSHRCKDPCHQKQCCGGFFTICSWGHQHPQARNCRFLDHRGNLAGTSELGSSRETVRPIHNPPKDPVIASTERALRIDPWQKYPHAAADSQRP